MLKEIFSGPRFLHDIRSLAAVAWVNSFAVLWLVLFGVIEGNMESGVAFTFFLILAIVTTTGTRKGQADD